MKIAINEEQLETTPFREILPGSLFTDPSGVDSPLYIKTNEGDSVCLSTGDIEDLFNPDYEVINKTDKYVIVNT